MSLAKVIIIRPLMENTIKAESVLFYKSTLFAVENSDIGVIFNTLQHKITKFFKADIRVMVQ